MTEESNTALDIKFQKRFSQNLLSNIIYFVLNIIIGLALVPFFLDTLGEAAYGLVPLATSVTSYVTILIDAMNGAVSRFLTVDLQRGDMRTAKETFNTSVFGTLFVILGIAPVALIIAWFAPSFFNIGMETPFAVFALFALVFCSALIRMWGSNFQVTLFAYNRLDLRNWVTSINLVAQVIAVVILFICAGPSLPSVGFSYLIAALLSLFAGMYFSKKVCPELVIKRCLFAKARFKEILGVTGWISASSLAYNLRYNVALMIVNVLLGEIAGTEYSLVLTWSTLLLGIAGLVINTLTPMSYSYRAKDDKTGLTEFTVFSMKIVGLVLSLPIGLVCIFSPQLLTIWVGEQYAILTPLIWITVAPLITRIQTICTDPIFAAYLRVRVPAIASILIGILNIGLIFAMVGLFKDGLYGVAYASTISMLLIQLFFQMYNAYVLGKPLTVFIKPVIYGVVPVFAIILAGFLITWAFQVQDIMGMVVVSLGISSVYGILLIKVILSEKERGMIKSCLPERIRGII